MATRKAIKKVRAKKPIARKPTAKQRIRKKIQTKVDRKLAEGVKLARQLGAQNLGPDEIAARVRAHLAGLGDDVVGDLMRLAGGSVVVHIG